MAGQGRPHASPVGLPQGSRGALRRRLGVVWGFCFAVAFIAIYGAVIPALVAAPDASSMFDAFDTRPTEEHRSYAEPAPSAATDTATEGDTVNADAGADDQHTGTMRLRIAWGGGAPRQWSGVIELSAGQFSELTPLGVDADETGSMRIENGQIIVQQRTPRSYDALDVLVRAPESAELIIRLATTDATGTAASNANAQRAHTETIPLRRLEHENVDRPAGREDNRLLVMRTPGDSLRVAFGAKRDALVFAPGDTLDLSVKPHLINAAAGSKIRLRAHLAAARGGKETWSQEIFRDLAADRSAPEWPLAVKLPEEPGAYDIHLEAHAWGLRQRFDPAKRIVPGAPLATRVVQVVVVDSKPAVVARTNAPMEVVVELDPANPRWWKRYIELPQLNKLALAPKNSWGFGKVERWDHPQLQAAIKLEVDAWEALPLPVETIGIPHIVEVDYPSDLPQTLGISILDPNAAGELAPVGLDSGVYTSVPMSGATSASNLQDAPTATGVKSNARWLRHRLIFWPRTKTPLLLLTNRDGRRMAVHGKIRVLAGGPQLPRAVAAGEPAAERLLAAYIERPLFPENFSASEARDAWSAKSLDDWRTFYEASTRFTEYLQHVGYGGAMVSVYSEGSTIYPSNVLQPTPRHDTGVFFSTGQDPIRKDVLELLLRVFDRERLTLIPAVQFSTPLPKLEAMLAARGADTTGIVPVGPHGNRAESSLAAVGTSACYNILDDRVQQAMLEVIAELVTRYANHSSLAGVGIQLSGDGYGLLPGPAYSLDDVTWAAFERDTGESIASRGARRFEYRADAVLGPKREVWLRWRAARVARFQQLAAAEVAKAGRDLRLFVSAASVWESPEVRDMVRPNLSRTATADEALLALGLDANIYSKPEFAQVVFLRPRRYAAPAPLEATAGDDVLNQSVELDRALARTVPAALAYHEPSRLRLASFDEKSPIGKDKTYTRLTTQFAPSDWENRRRFAQALAASDAVAMFDGGHLLTMGQEASSADLFAVYRHLPAGAFETLSANTKPVTIRMRSEARRTLCYLVNDSPWTVTVELEVAASVRCRVTSLAPQRRVNDLAPAANGATWRVTLDPYDVVGGTFSESGVTFANAKVNIDPQVAGDLRQQIADLGARTQRLASPPLYRGLGNPSFEDAAIGAQIPLWSVTTRAGVAVRLIDGAADGNQAIDMQSRGPIASLVSEWFEAPASGRLAVMAMLKTPDARQQPALRVALETSSGKTTDYRWRPVGAAPANVALRANWGLYLFKFDNLPTVKGAQVRVRFDLMSAGEVRIDDIKLHHLSFTDNEKTSLAKMVALADLYLGNGQIAESAKVLDGYWPRYLAANVPVDEVLQAARENAATTPKKPATAPESEADPPSPGMMERIKKLKPF